MNEIISVSGLKKYYDGGQIKALDDVDLSVEEGDFLAIMGPSGSGKSTLLNMIGGLERPDAGTLTVAGTNLAAKRDLTGFRSETVGFVFQLHNLMPALTALENVALPMFEGPLKGRARRLRAADLLEVVGLAARSHSKPTQLSGGERQRVAVARALANSPRIILADEPTGSLDSRSTELIMELLEKIWREENKTLIIITHDAGIAARARRVVHMLDGKITHP